MTRLPAVLLSMALLLPACGSGAAGERDTTPDGTSIVVTTRVLGDLISRLVDDAASVEVLLPTGADPHGYALSPRQVETARAADLLVVNGLGLEEGMLDAVASAEADGVRVFEAAAAVDTLPIGGDRHDDEAGEHEHEGDDPHFWLDPSRVATAMTGLAAVLAELDDTLDDAEWTARAEAVSAELAALEEEVRALLAVVAEEDRVLVTNHDAFEYFADAFDFEVVGTVVPGGSTLAEPSAADLEELVEAIEAAGVRAIFAEVEDPSGVAEAVAQEVGEDVEIAQLYSGSLSGPDGPAATYDEYMRYNATTIADALSRSATE